VWLATDERLDRPVAIKILSDTLTTDGEYIGRFRREAKVAASLQHPNLVPVYDFGSGERPYLVMEYIDGGDLATRLERGDAPDPERLARELLAALRHIHGARVLHRDIKPQNVLIDEHGHARLTDFGIAQPRDADSLTRTGHVLGTEAFIAPEVKVGEPASERSDLYALGVLLADVAREGAGTPLWTLTDRLRAREADLRPASAAEALAELERAASSAPPGAPTQPYEIGGFRGPFEPTATGGRGARRWWLRGLVILVAAALAAIIAIAVADSGGGGGQPGGAAQKRADAPRGQHRSQDGGGSGADSSGDQASAPATTTADAPGSSEPQASEPPPTDGSALNDQGFGLVSDGRYDEAVPVLQKAVDLLRGSGDEQTYNYALYNLGTALVGAGRYDEAIPVLQERLKYDDGQLDTVQAKLDEALAGAGQTPTGGTPEPKPPKEPKPGNPAPPGQTGAVPPGHQDDEGD
jgi:serine/threonine-protein kinase